MLYNIRMSSLKLYDRGLGQKTYNQCGIGMNFAHTTVYIRNLSDFSGAKSLQCISVFTKKTKKKHKHGQIFLNKEYLLNNDPKPRVNIYIKNVVVK